MLNGMIGVKAGEDFGFDCVDSTLNRDSSLQYEVVFKKDGNIVSQGKPLASIMITDATDIDDGIYECEIKNSAGMQQSNPINLQILCKCS